LGIYFLRDGSVGYWVLWLRFLIAKKGVFVFFSGHGYERSTLLSASAAGSGAANRGGPACLEHLPVRAYGVHASMSGRGRAADSGNVTA
jgi:hypothetical protein